MLFASAGYDKNYYVDAQAGAASNLWMNWRHTLRRS